MHKVGIRGKLYFAFVVFTFLCISSIWILEVWFLDDIYKSIRINTINTIAQRLDGMSTEDMKEYTENVSDRENICCAVYYFTNSGPNVIADRHAGGKCVVHNINIAEISLFYQVTSSFDDKYFESYLPAEEIVKVLNKNHQGMDSFRREFAYRYQTGENTDENSYDCVLHCQIIQDNENNPVFCMISSMIMPVDTTVQTIRFVLVIVSLFMLGLGAVFSVFMAKYITRPIIKLNRASKTLPTGEFNAPDAFGYKEVDELNSTLHSAAEEIGKVDDLRRELIANVSHDLRTPLTLISGYSEAMRDLPGENTPENLQTVIDETNRLSNLVNDMLDISKLESGMETVSKKPVNITSLISEIIYRYKKFVDKNGYKIIFEPEQDYYILADKIKMEQVLYNLINNAINYCGEDKTVNVIQSVNQDFIRISIIDHGEGISEDKLDKIWERYYKVDKNHKAAKVGTGLGLSIVRKALELHHAKYGVTSKIGVGSTFWFEFPIEKFETEGSNFVGNITE